MDGRKKKYRYFIAKSAQLGAIQKAIDTSSWACADRKTPPHPRDVLRDAMVDSEVVLIFSVNNQHGWHGYATVVTPPATMDASRVSEEMPSGSLPETHKAGGVDVVLEHLALKSDRSHDNVVHACINSDKMMQIDNSQCGDPMDAQSDAQNVPVSDICDSKWHRFQIHWHKVFMKDLGEQCLPFKMTKLIKDSDGTSINNMRNFDELDSEAGNSLCKLIDAHYDELSGRKRQKKEQQNASKKPAFFEPDKMEVSDEDMWREIVRKVEELGKVHLACVFGSQRYNLHREGSDLDMFLVYQAPTRDILGISKNPEQTIKNHSSETCDYTVHEIHRYSELLAGGDPRCVETLFMDESGIFICSEEWKELRESRQRFLTSPCVEKYLRDAEGAKGIRQLKKYESLDMSNPESIKKISKLCYIIIRLLQNAREITEGHIKVYRAMDSPERNLLMDIRNGKIKLETMKQEIDRLLADIKGRIEKNYYKGTSEQTFAMRDAEDWLLKLRMFNFKFDHH